MSSSHLAATMSNTTAQRHAESQDSSLGHLTVRPGTAPAEVHFLFERRDSRTAGSLVASVLSHVGLVLLVMLIMRIAPEAGSTSILPDRLPNDIVWLLEPGPGGGGGGGGNNSPEPPKEAELPGKEKLTVPAVKPPSPEITKKEEPPPEQTLTIPAKTMESGVDTSPGVLESNNASTSQGIGTGGGAGDGTGTGIGTGQGSGLGAGFGGGTGGGAYRPGNGVEVPRLVRDVKPQYTADAMRAKIQGVVLLECIVMPDGSVGEVRVRRSLDPTFGLDQEAIRAAKQWKFLPGTRFGEPVPVIVSIELTFSLR